MGERLKQSLIVTVFLANLLELLESRDSIKETLQRNHIQKAFWKLMRDYSETQICSKVQTLLKVHISYCMSERGSSKHTYTMYCSFILIVPFIILIVFIFMNTFST